MDPSKKPCGDFYQYARGGWLQHHVIPEASALYSISDILRDKLEVILKRVLENSTSNDRSAVQKAKTLYCSCMDESMIEKRGSQLLLDFLEPVGGWPVTGDVWNASVGPRRELEKQLAVMSSRFCQRVLVDLFVWNDDQNSSRHIIYVDQPTLGMPSHEYYLKDGTNWKLAFASACTALEDPSAHQAAITPPLQLNLLEDQHFENRLQNLTASGHWSPKRLWEKADRNLKEQPQALSFGGIGMVIRHEITHGFDDNGQNFDMDSNMHDWWSKRSARHFWRQSECMVYP
ncbi:Membrane metallo-endopeptidase-like 1 [Manis javanica]|nr:Membrane metallo-endopeptidase-like 1 [Manis javanica]